LTAFGGKANLFGKRSLISLIPNVHRQQGFSERHVMLAMDGFALQPVYR